MRRVLIMDDDPIHHKVAGAFITRYSILNDYTSYLNPVNALIDLTEAYCMSWSLPEVIFLDLNMPEVNGFEFLETFSKIAALTDQKTKVFIVSSSIDSNDKEKAYSYPCVKGFYSKPLSCDVFEAVATIVA